MEFRTKQEEIVSAALRVFSLKGFDKATNTEIAAEAGIGSAALLYHYFDSKESILRAVLDREAPGFQAGHALEQATNAPLKEALEQFALAYLSVLDHPQAVCMVKLVLGEAARRPWVAEAFDRAGPGRLFSLVERYMRSQIESGRLRSESPEIAARLFLGPLVVYVLGRELLGQPAAKRIEPAQMAREAVRCFLLGASTSCEREPSPREEPHPCLE
jgi:AcrR family transcriptional regulator